MPQTSKSAAAVVSLFVLCALAVTISRFNLTTDLGIFLPRGESVMEQVLMSQLEKGSTTNLVFAGISGGNPTEITETNRRFADALAKDDGVVQVLNGDTGLAKSDRDWVMSNRYHLTPSDLSQRFTVEGLKESLDERLRGLTSPIASLEKRFLPRDPTGEIIRLLKKWQGDAGQQGPETEEGVWISPDRTRSLMIIELRSVSLELENQQAAVERIQGLFESVKSPGNQLTLSGPTVFAVETRKVIAGDVRVLTIIATTLVVLFLLAAFRSVRLLLLVLVPLVGGVVAASAVVLLAFGNIHGITLAFGVTLTGVAVDYPIHFFSHLKGGRVHAEESIRGVWPTLRLGVVSTVIAYVVLMMSEFAGLQQLGLFTVVGLLTAAAITRWVLPFLVPNKLEVGRGLITVHRGLQKVGAKLTGLGPLTLLIIPIGAAVIYFSSTPLRNLDVDSLSPIGQDRRADDRSLRSDLGFWYGGKLAVVAAKSSEAALQGSEALVPKLNELVTQGALERFDMAASFIPSQLRQRAQIDAIPEDEELRARLNLALADFPFRQGIFEKFLKEAAAARQNPLVSVESLSNTQMGERLKALLFEQEGLWLAPILLHGVKDETALAILDQQNDNYQVIYLNIKGKATEILGVALDKVQPLLLLGVLAIYVLLAIGFRNLVKPLRVLFPTLSAVAVTLTILNLAGISLTLMHLVSLLLIVGLGLDYALFYNRLDDDREEWHTTFKALWVSSFTTILVFGILWFSNTPPLQAIGITVGIGALSCLILGACWTRTMESKGSDSID